MVQRVTTNDNEWQRVVQQVTTSDNEWQQVVQLVTTGDIEWWEVTTSSNFSQTFFFQIIWCWFEPLFISLHQRLLQTVQIDVFKSYVNWSRSTSVVFLKLSTSYLLFIIKICFFFFDEKQMFSKFDVFRNKTKTTSKNSENTWKVPVRLKIEYYTEFFLIYKKI